MFAKVLPSGGEIDVYSSPLVFIQPSFDRPQTSSADLEQAILNHLRDEPRYLEINILAGRRMFVGWGPRGGDRRELNDIELADDERTPEAIIRRLDQALASL